MAKLKMGDSKFGAPIGMYKARFKGVQENTHPEYGPGLQWEFEVIEGPERGKVISRTTSPQPSLKNSCGKMLNGLAGGMVGKDQEVDVDQFVGKVYQVMVEENSTGNGTRVGTVMPTNAGGGTPPPPPAANGNHPKPPAPPAPPGQAPVRIPTTAVAMYWVQVSGQEIKHMASNAIQGMIDSGTPAEEVMVMTDDQTSGWKVSTEFGFKPGEVRF